jgi:putative tryptophan/tyrosine transport system substrate-binding protein
MTADGKQRARSKRSRLRKAILITLCLPALLSPAVTRAQPVKIPRIGFLITSSPSAMAPRLETFRHGLRELGYAEGKDIVIEQRYGEGSSDQLAALAAELAHLKVDVLVTSGPTATRPAQQATSTIPIVMTFDDDPVGSGFVASLARPGSNITGLSTLAPEISGKRLELLKETLPKLGRVAVVGTSSRQGVAQAMKEMELTAAAFRLKLEFLDISDPKRIEGMFRAAAKALADAVLVLQSPIFNSYRAQITELAVTSRIPTVYPASQYAVDGGLMSYGASIADLDRRAASYVDRILKGAKPADLPVEQPTKFEFFINLKAAKQIGLTIPPNVLARADRVIR